MAYRPFTPNNSNLPPLQSLPGGLQGGTLGTSPSGGTTPMFTKPTNNTPNPMALMMTKGYNQTAMNPGGTVLPQNLQTGGAGSANPYLPPNLSNPNVTIAGTEGMSLNKPTTPLNAQQTAAGQNPVLRGNTFDQPGIGTYQTGITAGQLPQSAIDASMAALTPSQNLTNRPGYGTPVNRQQGNYLSQMLDDGLRQGTSTAQSDLARNGAYQQGQMQLGFDRARSDAMLGGFGNLYQGEAGRVANNQAQQSMLLNLLSQFGGML